MTIDAKTSQRLELVLFATRFKTTREAEDFCKALEREAKAGEPFEYHGAVINLPPIPYGHMRLVANIEYDTDNEQYPAYCEILYVDPLLEFKGLMSIRMKYDQWLQVKDKS